MRRRAFLALVAAAASVPFTGTAHAHHRPGHKGYRPPSEAVVTAPVLTVTHED